MTTVIYDKKSNQVAIDSRYTADGRISTDNGVKWRKSDDGAYWFFSGQPCVYEYLQDIFSGSSLKWGIENIPHAAAIHVKDGMVTIKSVDSEGFAYTEPVFDNEALGSGAIYALCALDFGCDCDEAVKYAARRDIYTGGKVHLFDVKRGEFTK